MKNTVYYAYALVDNKDVPNFLFSHAITSESKCAWALLLEKFYNQFKEEITNVLFEKSGKPYIQNGFISISHSNGAIAIAFSKDEEVGVDIELIRDTVPFKTASFINQTEPCSFYKTWTMREAVIKAKNYSALKNGVENEFEGINEKFIANEKAFYISVYGKNAKFIMV